MMTTPPVDLPKSPAFVQRHGGTRFSDTPKPWSNPSAETTSATVSSVCGRWSIDEIANPVLQLQHLPEGWNGAGFDRPDADAVWSATSWLMELYVHVSSSGMEWVQPHVTASASGEAVLEWWNGHRKLTMYFGPTGAPEYVKSWGPNIETEMEDGVASVETVRNVLWRWLFDVAN